MPQRAQSGPRRLTDLFFSVSSVAFMFVRLATEHTELNSFFICIHPRIENNWAATETAMTPGSFDSIPGMPMGQVSRSNCRSLIPLSLNLCTKRRCFVADPINPRKATSSRRSRVFAQVLVELVIVGHDQAIRCFW